jgi:hypothetical protein
LGCNASLDDKGSFCWLPSWKLYKVSGTIFGKNGVEDLKKCKHYLSKLIELEENKALGIKDVLQYQAGREAAELGFNRYGLGNEDWLKGYDKAKAKTNE